MHSHWFDVVVAEAVAHPCWDSTAVLGRRLHSWLDGPFCGTDESERKLYDTVGSILELVEDCSMLSVSRVSVRGRPFVRSAFCMPTCTRDTPGGDSFGFEEEVVLSADDARVAVGVAVELGWIYAPEYRVAVREHWASEWNL